MEHKGQGVLSLSSSLLRFFTVRLGLTTHVRVSICTVDARYRIYPSLRSRAFRGTRLQKCEGRRYIRYCTSTTMQCACKSFFHRWSKFHIYDDISILVQTRSGQRVWMHAHAGATPYTMTIPDEGVQWNCASLTKMIQNGAITVQDKDGIQLRPKRLVHSILHAFVV